VQPCNNTAVHLRTPHANGLEPRDHKAHLLLEHGRQEYHYCVEDLTASRFEEGGFVVTEPIARNCVVVGVDGGNTPVAGMAFAESSRDVEDANTAPVKGRRAEVVEENASGVDEDMGTLQDIDTLPRGTADEGSADEA
jgi:hypothetical protein